MNKNKDSLLTENQLTYILVGSMIGSSVLTLPIDVVKYAEQDGWISCILGLIYPMYMFFIAHYMYKKFPKENILILSKKCFGKIIGTILNFIFIIFFLLILTEAASGIANLLKIYMVSFLDKNKILITIFLPATFIAYKGIKPLGKTNEVIFYLTFLAFIIPIGALKDGMLINIMPVFGSGIVNIIKATKETALAYSGMEILFLIYPFLQDNKSLKKCGLKSVLITGIVYTWFVFITIYYLGIDIIPKFIWPLVTVTEAITIPVINNFRYIFIVLWTVIMIKILSNYYYSFTFGLSEIIKKVSRKQFIFLMYPLIFYLSTKYENTIIRGDFASKIIPVYVIFNLIYVSAVALFININNRKISAQK
jgi:spore germination protein (amino acid permease)